MCNRLLLQADHFNSGSRHQSRVHHLRYHGDDTPDVLRLVYDRDDDWAVAADQMGSVQFGRFALALKATEDGGASDLPLTALGHNRLVQRFALMPIRL